IGECGNARPNAGPRQMPGDDICPRGNASKIRRQAPARRLQLQAAVKPAEDSHPVMGATPQIVEAYSRIARSDENLPLRATFTIDDLIHDDGDRHASATRR